MAPQESRDDLNRSLWVRSRVVELARQLVAREIGVVAAARELVALKGDVEPEFRSALDVFVGIDSETDTLPIGEVRKDWHPRALEREDVKIEAAEELYCRQATEAARTILCIAGQGTHVI